MDQWFGRVALVTGASSGIGRAIAISLAQHGMKVVTCGRNIERLKNLAETHNSNEVTIVPVQCDLRKEEDILNMFDKIRSELGGVDICVNNAAVSHYATTLLSGSTEQWREMLEVNVLAVSICTREAIKSMRERGVDDGFIVNIGSYLGHYTELLREFPAFYSGAKHAVRSFSTALSCELRSCKSRIRVMEVIPGVVITELHERYGGKEFAENLVSKFELLTVEDVVASVIHGLSAASRAQISEVILVPVDEVTIH